jgi:hypothetical protein
MGIANVTALKKIVAEHKTAPLDDVARAINIKMELAVEADNKAGSHRLDAGRMLVELRRRVEEAGDDWWKWQKGKFTRTRRDIEKLMKMASADEPEVASEAERAKNAEQHRAARAKRRPGGEVRRSGADDLPEPPTQASAASPTDLLIEGALRLVRQMTDHQRHVFMAQLKEEFS